MGLIPPGIGKRLWYLDLGHPAFGMNPLRLTGDRPLPVEAAQLAENIVAALLDINENQIFQSSRRYLYHAVIGAIAYAETLGRRARLEDLHILLLPAKYDFRATVAQACSDQPDLDQTAEFFAHELPDELRYAGSAGTAQRLDAPRNKVAGLVGVPALRRFFNHPTDIPLGQIIADRDALIVSANMGAIGPDNSKACLHFTLSSPLSELSSLVTFSAPAISEPLSAPEPRAPGQAPHTRRSPGLGYTCRAHGQGRYDGLRTRTLSSTRGTFGACAF